MKRDLAEHFQAFVDARQKMTGPIDQDHILTIVVGGDEHRLTTADLLDAAHLIKRLRSEVERCRPPKEAD